MATLGLPGIRLKRMTDVHPLTYRSILWNPANPPLVPKVVQAVRARVPAALRELGAGRRSAAG